MTIEKKQGIYIPGMFLPKNCFSCKLRQETSYEWAKGYCPVTGNYVSPEDGDPNADTRSEVCTLRECFTMETHFDYGPVNPEK